MLSARTEVPRISAKPVERDPAHLKEIYEVGRRVMKADMEKLKAYLMIMFSLSAGSESGDRFPSDCN